jgi:hypothetical protein
LSLVSEGKHFDLMYGCAGLFLLTQTNVISLEAFDAGEAINCNPPKARTAESKVAKRPAIFMGVLSGLGVNHLG